MGWVSEACPSPYIFAVDPDSMTKTFFGKCSPRIFKDCALKNKTNYGSGKSVQHYSYEHDGAHSKKGEYKYTKIFGFASIRISCL